MTSLAMRELESHGRKHQAAQARASLGLNLAPADGCDPRGRDTAQPPAVRRCHSTKTPPGPNSLQLPDSQRKEHARCPSGTFKCSNGCSEPTAPCSRRRMEAVDASVAAGELGRQWLFVARQREHGGERAQEGGLEEGRSGRRATEEVQALGRAQARAPSSKFQPTRAANDSICRIGSSQVEVEVRANKAQRRESGQRPKNTQDAIKTRGEQQDTFRLARALAAADAATDKLAKTIDYRAPPATGDGDLSNSQRANRTGQSASAKGGTRGKEVELQAELQRRQAGQVGSQAPGSSGSLQQRRGLLEALLGERGRSWFQHKTVILDINNGNKKTLRGDHHDGERSRPQAVGESGDQKQESQASAAPQLNTTSVRTQVPTFGSVAQRLAPRRLPYFSYHGQTKSVETGRPSERYKPRGQQQANSVDSSSSGTASSFASASSSSSSSSATRFEAAAAALRVGRASRLGYSNISNLFPNEPVQGRVQTTARQAHRHTNSHQIRQATRARPEAGQKSASLLNLQTASRQPEARSNYATNNRPRQQLELTSDGRNWHLPALSPVTQRQQQAKATETTPRQQLLRASRSQQSLLTAATRPAAMSTIRRQQQMRPGGGGGGGSRPMSATGNYIATGRGAHYRSPSGNSLQRRASSYRPGSAGMSPLVDPECPVHGEHLLGHESPPPMPPAGRRPGGYQYGAKEPLEPHQRLVGYSSSQPDLLYGGGGGFQDVDYEPIHDPYNRYAAYEPPIYAASQANRSPQDYSPVSPTYPAPGGRYTWNSASKLGASNGHLARPKQRGPSAAQQDHDEQQQAYYNGSSRFSLYHPSENGLRSSLAPASEQLRRILGYKPPPAGARPVHLHPQWAYTRPFIHLKPAGSGFGLSPVLDEDSAELVSGHDESIRFAPFNRLQDSQAIRAVDFHPGGQVYAIGSNSRSLRICAYPAEHELRHFDPPELDQEADRSQIGAVKAPRVLFKFLQVHRGSIYCVAFNPGGQLLATGSNDQTVHLVKYNSVTHNPDGEEFRLTMHNGTVRDLCFIDDSSGNGSSLLLSAGGGDNKIFVTDTQAVTPFQSMAGHTQMVMSLQHCGGVQFASASYDRTIRLWDLRSRSCTSIVSAPPSSAPSGQTGGATSAGPGAPVCSLCVDPSGRLMVSGHSDSTCMLYDIRGGKIIQTFRPHDDEIRAISFSPKSYYLLTGGYDGRLIVSDLQGDLTQPLPSVCAAETKDKIVQTKWHTEDFTFVSTSAGGAATLWSLPGEIRN